MSLMPTGTPCSAPRARSRAHRVEPLAGGPAGAVGIDRHPRLDARLERVDAREAGLDEVDGRQRAGADPRRRLRRRQPAEIVHPSYTSVRRMTSARPSMYSPIFRPRALK